MKNLKEKLICVYKITAAHTITYFIFGLLAFTLLNYRELYSAKPLSYFMLSVDSPVVALGSSLQVIRGIIIALVLLPFYTVIFEKERGWLKLWILLLGLSIISTYGPAPGSFEGLLFTKIPFLMQMKYLPEVILQSFVFSILAYYWNRSDKKIWIVSSAILVILIILSGIAGFYFRMHQMDEPKIMYGMMQ